MFREGLYPRPFPLHLNRLTEVLHGSIIARPRTVGCNQLRVRQEISYPFAARDFSLRLGASDEHTPRASVRSEQRRQSEKELPPEGLRSNWPGASLLGRSSIAADTLPPSRLAPGQFESNECIAYFLTDPKWPISQIRSRSSVDDPIHLVYFLQKFTCHDYEQLG